MARGQIRVLLYNKSDAGIERLLADAWQEAAQLSRYSIPGKKQSIYTWEAGDESPEGFAGENLLLKAW